MSKLPDKIYIIIDPYDEDGNLLPNIRDVYWCAEPAGAVNVAYIAERAVADALATLRTKLAAAEALLLLYNEWEEDLDDTDSKSCIICGGGGHRDGRRKQPIRHRPGCAREAWNKAKYD